MKSFDGYKRGVNLGGWLSQCVEYTDSHFDNFITDDDIAKIKEWGMDHVRLPIDCDVIANDDCSFNSKGIVHVDDCIRWCEAEGLNVILDLHKTFGYTFDTDVVADPGVFFKDKTLQGKFVELWKTLATRYGNDPHVAFELLNEVTDPVFEDSWNSIATEAIKSIRQISPQSDIIIGGVNNNGVMNVKGINIPLDEHIIYTFHFYEPIAFTHQNACWIKGISDEGAIGYPAPLSRYREIVKKYLPIQAEILMQDCVKSEESLFEDLFADAVSVAEEAGVPLYCGEYGVIDRAEIDDAIRWAERICNAFEKYNIGHAMWNYKEKDFGLSGKREALVKYI